MDRILNPSNSATLPSKAIPTCLSTHSQRPSAGSWWNYANLVAGPGISHVRMKPGPVRTYWCWKPRRRSFSLFRSCRPAVPQAENCFYDVAANNYTLVMVSTVRETPRFPHVSARGTRAKFQRSTGFDFELAGAEYDFLQYFLRGKKAL